jgi:4-diphosphocytidyl-2C-methyl-D-erythritol kinase
VDINETEIPFLDIVIIKENRNITTDMFYQKKKKNKKKPKTKTKTNNKKKKTTPDTHQYLVFNSCHPHRV